MINLRIALEHDHEFRGEEGERLEYDHDEFKTAELEMEKDFNFDVMPLVKAMESERPFSRRHRSEGIALESFDPAWIVVGMAIAAAALVKLLFWFLGDGNGSKGGGGGFGRSEATIPQLRVKLERVNMGEDIRKASKHMHMPKENIPEEKWATELNRYDTEFFEGGPLGKVVSSQMENTDWYLSSCNKLLDWVLRAREAWGDQMEHKPLTEGQQRGLDSTNEEFELLVAGMAKKWGASSSESFNEKVFELTHDIDKNRGYRLLKQDAEKFKSVFARKSGEYLDKYEQSLPKYKADMVSIEAKLKSITGGGESSNDWNARRMAALKIGEPGLKLPVPETWAGIERLEKNFKNVINTVRATLRVCHLSVSTVDRINHLATVRLNDDRAFIRYLATVPKEDRDDEVNDLISKYKD